MGGPNISVVLDIVKNKEALLEPEELNNYEFWMAESALIDNRIQYVINFRPRVLLPYALFHGKLYVDCDKLSFTRIEMNLDMQNKSKAIAAILHQKPFGLRFKPQELSFLITYKTIDGRTYLNYIRNDIRFKCDWKRRLFSTSYAVTSEMVVQIGGRVRPSNSAGIKYLPPIRFSMIKSEITGVKTSGEIIIS